MRILPLVEPVVRHGREPEYYEMHELVGVGIQRIYEGIIERGHQSVALICKTRKEAKGIFHLSTGVWNAGSLSRRSNWN